MASLTPEQRDAVIEQFKKFDSVVAIGNVPDADVNAMQSAGVNVVDARHMLEPADTALAVATPITAIYTGVVPIVYKASRALLDSLIQSSFWSFVTITSRSPRTRSTSTRAASSARSAC